jgi:hypothetical protein
MSISNYTELVNTIKAWSARSDIDTVMDDIITLAEKHINDIIKINEVKTRTVLSTVPGNNYVILPTDFNKVISVKIGGKSLGFYTNNQEGVFNSQNTGEPFYGYTLEGNKLYTLPLNTSSDVELVYYKKLTPITPSNPTNEVLTAYPNIYHKACLLYTHEFAHNVEMFASYSALLDTEVSRANSNSFNMANATLVMR